MDNYVDKNRASWNARTEFHVQSAFYDMEGFLKGATSLNEVELQLLGDIRGKSILHLQCHFGQDTLSMARMGAKVTGADLADKAIEKAREIAASMGADARFVCCDVYDLPNHLDEKFDIVFTSYGAIGWLPDLDKWAEVVAHFLKPDGQFTLVEFHPVVWMFDEDFKSITYSYFNGEAMVETSSGTYADRDAPITTENVSWNHPLSEVMSGLRKQGLEILAFDEYDYSPYACFNRVVEIGPKRYQIEGLAGKIPMLYSVVAAKKK